MLFRTALLAAASLALVSCGQPKAPAEAPKEVSALTPRPLPDSVTYPEGIAYDADEGVYYTASAVDGAVVKVKLSDNTATVVVPGGKLVPAGATEFPAILGMKLDEAKRLWIAGGVLGNLHIVDTKTGQTVKTLTTPAEPAGLLNDLVFTADAAYVTDTFRPTLWRASRSGGAIGALEPWLKLDPAIAYAEGPNINGIVATPDGKTLLLVQMNKGLLWKVDVATKAITQVDLKGAILGRADGLVLDGQRLYAVLQETTEVVAVDLDPDFASGTVVGHLKSDEFVAPATAFKANDKLYLVVTQFSRREDNTATRPFKIFEMPVAAIK